MTPTVPPQLETESPATTESPSTAHPSSAMRARILSPSLPESHRTIPFSSGASWIRKVLAFAGPGYLVAVGYMDPGNWATDLGGGSKFGYTLLSVVLISNIMAMFLQGLSAKLGIASRITWAGMVSGSAKWGALRASKVFLLPSHQENFGISVVEALAASVPVLISNRVNIWREIQADRAGYVESDDLAGTSRLLQRWIDTAPTERATIRQNALRCFEQRFEIDRAVDSLLRILNEPRTA